MSNVLFVIVIYYHYYYCFLHLLFVLCNGLLVAMCNMYSTSQKHISGTVDLHTLLPSMQKLGGRWLKSCPYGSHLTYKSHQVKQPHSEIFP